MISSVGRNCALINCVSHFGLCLSLPFPSSWIYMPSSSILLCQGHWLPKTCSWFTLLQSRGEEGLHIIVPRNESWSSLDLWSSYREICSRNSPITAFCPYDSYWSCYLWLTYFLRNTLRKDFFRPRLFGPASFLCTSFPLIPVDATLPGTEWTISPHSHKQIPCSPVQQVSRTCWSHCSEKLSPETPSWAAAIAQLHVCGSFLASLFPWRKRKTLV